MVELVSDREKELLEKIINTPSMDAIVVEGYDGVGKGRILNILSEHYGVIPYRPDYNFWNQFDLAKKDRWKISGFFWDVFSHFYHHTPGDNILLFDRGVVSGAVYNEEPMIGTHYKELLRDMNVLHVLVMCDRVDHDRFMEMRNPNISQEEKDIEWLKYRRYNEKYVRTLKNIGVPHILYSNRYDSKLAELISSKCVGCGHYSYGYCTHPDIQQSVDSNQQRCEKSNDKEAQDR